MKTEREKNWEFWAGVWMVELTQAHSKLDFIWHGSLPNDSWIAAVYGGRPLWTIRYSTQQGGWTVSPTTMRSLGHGPRYNSSPLKAFNHALKLAETTRNYVNSLLEPIEEVEWPVKDKD